MSGTKKIRIAYILNSLQHGGVERYVLNLYKNLDPERFEPILICLRQTKSPMEEELERESIAVKFVPRKVGSDFGIYRLLADAIEESGTQIVHSNNWGTYLEAALASRRIPGVKHIHVQHGLEFDEKKRLGLIKYTAVSVVRRIVGRSTHQYISVSHIGSRYLQDKWGAPADKLNVIYNGIDYQRFTPNPDLRVKYRQELGLNENDFAIGTVGRFHPVKNFPLLITAMDGLEKQASNARLFLIGGSEESPLFARLNGIVTERKLRDRVTFLFKRNDIHQILNAFDVFVLPSKSEGLSISILEALSSGLPVIASNVGGNPELVFPDENGLLFESGDVKGLQSALARFANEPALRKQLGANARGIIEEKFSQQKMLNDYMDIYQRLAGA
jgi:sugar transferase (PEP-CTERM/EpsH1 system associated)